MNRNEEKCNEYDFDVGHLKNDLKYRSVSGGIVSVTSGVFKFSLKAVSTIILARLLTPVDYGIIGMVSAVIHIMDLFKDMGLSMATVRNQNINHDQVNSLFWINVGVGALIMVLLSLVSPAITSFYEEPHIRDVTIALSCGFFIGAFSIQHVALMRRQMRYTSIAIIEISGLAVSILVAVLAAWNGMRYWSLVLMQLSMITTMSILSWVLCVWRPGKPKIRGNIQNMLSFGRNLTLFNFINYFARNLDNILIGKYIGPEKLGYYSRAYTLLLLPMSQINQPITHVAIPTLSQLQTDSVRYKNYYCKAVKLIAYATMPIVTVMAVLSDEMIRIVLGDQWIEAGNIFKILAIGALVQPVNNCCGWIYISLGQTDRMVKWGMISVPVIILSFIIGLNWGVIGVAICYTIATYILLYPSFYFAFKHSPVKTYDIALNVWRPLVFSIVISAIMYVVRILMINEPLFHRTLICLFSAIISISIMYIFWTKVREDISMIIDLLRISKTYISVDQ
jgi:PST family polysaccharide transporter